MLLRTHILSAPGVAVADGFWLYALRVESPKGELIYVGMTGSNDLRNSKSAFRRFWWHLDPHPPKSKTYSVFRDSPDFADIDPWQCGEIRMVAVGPIYPVTNNRDEFGGNRKQMLAMEGQLINDLDAAGYNVVNKINGTGALDDSLWQQVRAEFALHFPKLANPIH